MGAVAPEDGAQRDLGDMRVAGEEGVARLHPGGVAEIAAREWAAVGPRGLEPREVRRQLVDGLLGQAPIGRDLAAEHRQYGRPARVIIHAQRVVPRHCGGVVRAVVVERPHPCIAPHHVLRPRGARQVPVHRPAQVVDLLCARLGLCRFVRHRDVGRAHQGMQVAVGNHENDPPVVVLQDERVLALVEFRQDDMAALHQAHRVPRRLLQMIVQHRLHPGPGCVHDCLRPNLCAVGQACDPEPVLALRLQALGARQHLHTTLSCVHRVGDHEARVVDAAIGIDEAAPELRLEPRIVGRRIEPDGAGARQAGAPRQAVVEEQSGADHPARPQLGHMRHDEARRPDQVRGHFEQHFALGERFGNQPELVML